jgi:hypothetical protein
VKRFAAAALLPVLLLATAAVFVVHRDIRTGVCWVAPPAGSQGGATLDTTQVANARIIVGVAGQLGLPPRAAVIAVATAKQESDLRNLKYGDRDSLGLFQQRPSQGWGTPEQVLDPVYAATRFFQRLTGVPGWPQLPLTVAAQAVQRSAFPDAYGRWELLAIRVVAAVAGVDRAALSCRIDDAVGLASGSGSYPPETMGADGLTSRARAAVVAVTRAFGVTDIGGYCPGGCRSGHIPGSDHYTGHAVDIMLTPMTETNRAIGDQIAAWLVANADRLAVKYVIWYERIWTPAEGWHAYAHPSGQTTSPTLAHRDHVHLSVW